MIPAPWPNGAPTASARWPPGPTGWPAAADGPTAPPARNTASAVVIHVIAEQATVEGTGHTPAAMIGYDGLIPAELIAELAHTARCQPLIHPGDAPAETGYRPSKALADFVRHRDLTCRFPHCDVPASDCDIDHVIPHGDGGPTHASNLSCKCRFHHLLKTVLGLARRTTPRRHPDLDQPHRAQDRHPPRQRPDLPHPVRPHRTPHRGRRRR